MKKTLKVVAVVLGSLFIIGVILILLLVKALPSTWELKQAMSPLKAKKPEFAAGPSVSGQTPRVPEVTPPEIIKKVDESKVLSQAVLRQDFLNEKKPKKNSANKKGTTSS